MQALQYDVELGVLCASFVVRSSTGKYFVKALSYEVLRSCFAQDELCLQCTKTLKERDAKRKT